MAFPGAIDAACPWMTYPATIDEIIPEIPGVATYSLRLQTEHVDSRYRFQAGQFNMLYLPGIGEVAISVSGNPSDSDRLPHTIREAGAVTQALSRLSTKSTVGVRGPFGSYWPLDHCGGKDIVLVAGGIGLAPLRPVVYELLAHRERFGDIALLYGARTPRDLLYSRQFESWMSRGITVQTTVDRANEEWPGCVGVVTLLFDRLRLPNPSETVLMTCGPEVMMWYVVQTALARGFADENIWLSLERNMNCAIGLCGHCQFGPVFICKDGPVFRYDRISPFLRTPSL